MSEVQYIDRHTVIITLNQLYEGDPMVDDTWIDDDLINAYISSGLFEDHYGMAEPDIQLQPERG